MVRPSATRELDSIPKKILQQITKRLQALAENPRPPGCDKLSGQERYRVRQGDYRIVYGIDDSAKVVDVVKIAHRREVYR
jgi:mRNA interferase RelE/StbE